MDQLQKPVGSVQRASVLGYIDGVHDAFDGAGFKVPHGVTSQALGDVVLKYLKLHPKEHEKDAVYIVIDALSGAYPKQIK